MPTDSIGRIKRYYDFIASVPDFDKEERAYAYLAYMAYKVGSEEPEDINLQELYESTGRRFLGSMEDKDSRAEEVKQAVTALQSKFYLLFTSTRMITEPGLPVLLKVFFNDHVEEVQDTKRFIMDIAKALQ